MVANSKDQQNDADWDLRNFINYILLSASSVKATKKTALVMKAIAAKESHMPAKSVTTPASPNMFAKNPKRGAASIGPKPSIMIPNTVWAEFRISSSAILSTYI